MLIRWHMVYEARNDTTCGVLSQIFMIAVIVFVHVYIAYLLRVAQDFINELADD